MSLPLLLDVVIGLVFIYLILSLLASEIQELLTTLLQWRAKHLKDSIEVLLSGGVGTEQEEKVRDLVSNLYNDPLIKNINQEAKGVFSRGARKITRLLPGNRRGAFGKKQTSGPSYIGPETFATSLIERLGLAILIDKLVEIRLEKFAGRIIGKYSTQDGLVLIPSDSEFANESEWDKGRIRVIASKSGKNNLKEDRNFITLVEEYDDILNDFKAGESTLSACVERMGESLNVYIASYPALESQNISVPSLEFNHEEFLEQPSEDITYFINRLKLFKTGLFGENNERAIVSGGLRLNLFEVAELIDESSNTYREVKNAYEATKTQGELIEQRIDEYLNSQGITTLKYLSNDERNLTINEAMFALNLTREERRLYENYVTYLNIQEVLSKLPSSIKESLAILARRAQTKVHEVGNELEQFRDEVALWFDNSMSRASGVYKRNAKGVAIILGLILAAITNSDSFNIVTRLSNDDDLRRIVTEQAINFAPSNNDVPLTRDQLTKLRDEADSVLQNLSVPIGWKPENLTGQFDCPSTSTGNPNQGGNLNQVCFDSSVPTLTSFFQMLPRQPLNFFKVLLGWLISGIAISMGASFWFDLLGKIVNVRNSGGKPRSEASRASQENNP